MAVLSDALRAFLWRIAMRHTSLGVNLDSLVPGGIQKSDWMAAIVAADVWVDGQASAYNVALPQPYRNAASANQKAALLALVTLARTTGMVEVNE